MPRHRSQRDARGRLVRACVAAGLPALLPATLAGCRAGPLISSTSIVCVDAESWGELEGEHRSDAQAIAIELLRMLRDAARGPGESPPDTGTETGTNTDTMTDTDTDTGTGQG